MSEIDYRERIKGLKSEYDPMAWARMRDTLASQVSNPKKKRTVLPFFWMAAAGIIGLVIWQALADNTEPVDRSLNNEPSGITHKDSTQNKTDNKTLQADVTDTPNDRVKPKDLQAEKASVNNAPFLPKTGADNQNERIVQTVSNSDNEVPLYEADELGAKNSLLLFNPDLISEIHPLQYQVERNMETPGPLKVQYDSIVQRRKFRAWDLFVSTGFNHGSGAAKDFKGQVQDMLIGGLGLKITERTMFQAHFAKRYNKLGFSYLFGDYRFKFGPELNLLIADGAIGPSFGLGAYHHISDDVRIFSKYSFTNYRVFGSSQSSVSEFTVGTQLRLANLVSFERQSIRIMNRRRLKAAFNINSSKEWEWFGSAYLDLLHFFGDGGNAGLGAGKYLSEKSFVQFGLRFPLSGYKFKSVINQLSSTDKFGLSVNYNQLIGEHRWFGLIQAGINIRSGYPTFFSKDFGKGTFTTNLGLGALYKANDRMRLFVLGNLHDPYTTLSFDPRFSIQVGAQFRLN